MLSYVVRRLIWMVISLMILSVVVFVIIQLPPGDYLTTYVANLAQSGEYISDRQIVVLEKQLGLDQPMHVQYFKWITNIFRGDLGMSFDWKEPVVDILYDRLPLTMALALFTFIFTYAVAIPIGIYSATHQHSAGDYISTVIGFVGLATPNFLLALILMVIFFRFFGISVGGLFSREYVMASWSWGKFVDMMNHMWVPVIVVGTAGTCGLIRVMRGCLLDELHKQYVITARAKGVSETALLFKYPVRMAVNPIISIMGWQLARIISGASITAVVLSLPTAGATLLRALLTQDMYLAGTIVLFLSALVIIGSLVSDILLAVVDPRIRYEK